MTDLVAFLTARWDEEEAVAKSTAAYPYQWESHPEETGQPIKAGGYRIATCAESVMAHIALHDPAHVLADLAAKRAILALHRGEWADDLDVTGKGCEHDYDPWPCLTVRLLAQPHRQHPDFKPAWEV